MIIESITRVRATAITGIRSRRPNQPPEERACLYCGNKFKALQCEIRKGGGKYCSVECRVSAKFSRANCICGQCGKTFSVVGSKVAYGKAKYCSRSCRAVALQKRVQCVCIECGKPFEAKASDVKKGKSKLCSIKCRGLFQTGAKNHQWRGGSTSSYYGPDWKRQRDLAYKRDGGICQVCHRKARKGEKTFGVHHIVKRKFFAFDDPTANALSNLITLCTDCHPKADHGLIPVPVRLL